MLVELLSGICAVLLYVFIWLKSKANDTGHGIPIPGPKGIPLFGSLFEFELGNLHNIASKHAAEFGDIVQLRLLHEHVVFLNTADFIRKAYMDERYKRFLNDRPVTFYGENFQYGSKGLIMNKRGYSPRHAQLRKHFAKGLKAYGDGVTAFEDIINREISDMMEVVRLHKDHEVFEFLPILENSLSNLLSVLMCGEKRATNEHVSLFWDYIEMVNYVGTPKFDTIMKFFPFLKYLPGPYGSACRKLERMREQLIDLFLTRQKESFMPGKVRGLMDYLIHEQLKEISENKQDRLFTDEMLFALIADVVLAGLITTRAAMANMFFCLMHHLEYQFKIQNELDRVVGRNRRPTLNDRNQMPMLEAVAMESQRYLTTGVVMAHLANEDVNFEGFHIKKNTFVFPNMWYVHHDQKIWGDPWTFRPERFLDNEGNLLPMEHPLRKSWVIFGMGRRHCVGESLARSRMFLYMANMLQKWNIFPARDATGSCCICDPRSSDVEVKIVTSPKPFKCYIRKRW
ncbi:cytochrome P450 2C31-like [Dreissena polymorpha]|uniref:Cytochrome P450 n=1 Tax=Dreissena polymorpha TaxID=45954 RepID=A0A9D3YE17_DREPO|nr:cytochrome P450 2C31-like [Dreissena polymorpha]KAH3697076.1 hypothetical protein DPMN_084561 [Dreissena polymorpha]